MKLASSASGRLSGALRKLVAVTLVSAVLGCVAAPHAAHASGVEVFKPALSLQCESGSGVGADELRAELKANGIAVIAYRSGHDGLMRPTVCGAPTGALHIFSVPAAAVATAESLGYRRLVDSR